MQSYVRDYPLGSHTAAIVELTRTLSLQYGTSITHDQMEDFLDFQWNTLIADINDIVDGHPYFEAVDVYNFDDFWILNQTLLNERTEIENRAINYHSIGARIVALNNMTSSWDTALRHNGRIWQNWTHRPISLQIYEDVKSSDNIYNFIHTMLVDLVEEANYIIQNIPLFADNDINNLQDFYQLNESVISTPENARLFWRMADLLNSSEMNFVLTQISIYEFCLHLYETSSSEDIFLETLNYYYHRALAGGFSDRTLERLAQITPENAHLNILYDSTIGNTNLFFFFLSLFHIFFPFPIHAWQLYHVIGRDVIYTCAWGCIFSDYHFIFQQKLGALYY